MGISEWKSLTVIHQWWAVSRSAKKAATRQRLIAAAWDSFDEDGATTTIASIARRAGVAHGTIYVHFPSRAALVDELLDTFNLELAAAVTPLWRGMGTSGAREAIRGTVAVFFDALAARRGFVEACVDRFAGTLTAGALAQGVNPPVAQALGSALEANGVENAQLVGLALLAMWLRVGLQMLFNPEVDRGEAEATLLAMTLGVLAEVMGR